MTDGTSPGDLRYVESVSPGHGYAPARASGAKGSIQLSLDGIWKFGYGQGLGDLTAGFEASDFDDAHFDDILVPSSWQLAGIPGPLRYGSPAYTPDLVPDGRTYVHLDAAHHGIGSGSCGPRVLPGHTLVAHTVAYTLRFSALAR